MKTFVAIIPPENSTTADPAAKEHQFESPSWECAQALCDAMGWKLDGELRETCDPAAGEDWKKKQEPELHGPATGDALFTDGQKATISQLAKSAFDHMDKYGLIEGINDDQCQSNRCRDWRRMIVKKVTGKDSLTKCRNSHYRMLEAEFMKLGGNKYENPQAFQTGKQSRRKGDTMEAREKVIYHIKMDLEMHAQNMRELGKESDTITEGYVLTIARAQNKRTRLVDFDSLITLPADILERLLYTTRNRIAAKEGRGDARNRNKNQRKGKK